MGYSKCLLLPMIFITVCISCKKENKEFFKSFANEVITGKSTSGAGNGGKFGTMKDIDGNIYKTVAIGNQIWMAENLKVVRYRNGDSIAYVPNGTDWTNSSTGAWSYYKNDFAVGQFYGKLYNWYAVNDYRGLAPKGWHVASDEEWNTLTTFLEGVTLAGGHLKSTGIYELGTGLWLSPNYGALDDVRFSGLPGGNRQWTGGDGNNINAVTYWWSSSSYDTDNAYCRSLSYASTMIYSNTNPKKDGNYIRCIKDSNK